MQYANNTTLSTYLWELNDKGENNPEVELKILRNSV